MPLTICLYLDDSGTRNPDRKTQQRQFDDWFAVGGILINEEDENKARDLHDSFCEKWGITYPLHSCEIRSRQHNFSWLGSLDKNSFEEFMRELTDLIVGIPAQGHACVIDRPGYAKRYQEKYGRQTWMLCKTAFTVICERAAKIARAKGRKLRIFPERSGRREDSLIQDYYNELRTKGMPFSGDTSSKYQPLSAEELKDTLYSLKFKAKSSALAQLADLYLYPIARGGYEMGYRPYTILRAHKKLIDDELDDETRNIIGIKYSCFEHVRRG